MVSSSMDRLLGDVAVLHSPFFGFGKLEYYLAARRPAGGARRRRLRKPAAPLLGARPGLPALAAQRIASGVGFHPEKPITGLRARVAVWPERRVYKNAQKRGGHARRFVTKKGRLVNGRNRKIPSKNRARPRLWVNVDLETLTIAWTRLRHSGEWDAC